MASKPQFINKVYNDKELLINNKVNNNIEKEEKKELSDNKILDSNNIGLRIDILV